MMADALRPASWKAALMGNVSEPIARAVCSGSSGMVGPTGLPRRAWLVRLTGAQCWLC